MPAAQLDQVLQSLPISVADTSRWDREWLTYLNLPWADVRGYLRPYDTLAMRPGVLPEMNGLSADAMPDYQLFDGMTPLEIWAPGVDIVGKTVLEFGCGPGHLGKQLGCVAKDYIGFDHSEFALSIARLVSGPNCHYIHVSELPQSHRGGYKLVPTANGAIRLSDGAGVLRFRGRVDTMIARHFFIHQNFESARWVLTSAHMMLRPGGAVYADFYRANPATEQGVVFPAKSPLSKDFPSCAFEYTDADIAELAEETGLRVTVATTHLPMQRRFVRLEK